MGQSLNVIVKLVDLAVLKQHVSLDFPGLGANKWPLLPCCHFPLLSLAPKKC